MEVGIVENTALASVMLPVAIAYNAVVIDDDIDRESRQIDRSVRIAGSISKYRNLMGAFINDGLTDGPLTTADRLSEYSKWADHLASTCSIKLVFSPGKRRIEDRLESVRDDHFKTRFAPNYTVYTAAYDILQAGLWSAPGVAASMQLALKFSRVRLVKNQSKINIPSPVDPDSTVEAIFFESVASELETSFKAAMAFKSTVDKEADTKHYLGPQTKAIKDAYSKYEVERSHRYEVIVVGQMVAMRFNKQEYMFTAKHFTRLVCMFRSFAQTAIMWRDLSPKVSCLTAVTEVIRQATNCDPMIVDHFPSGLKGAKQVIVASLDRDHIMGSDPATELLRTYGPEKRVITQALMQATRRMFKCDISRANFLNLYRSMPHPDYDPEMLFETIEGLHEPNTVKACRITPFEGRVRRTMFTNLLAQKCRVNVESKAEFFRDSAVINAVSALNENNATMAVANSISDLVWSKLKLVADYKNPKRYVLKPENKSSALHISFDDYLRTAEPGAVHCNDLVMAATIGEKRYMHVADAYRRFVTMVRKTLDNLGIDGIVIPDELPVTSMSPKYGEYHKFNTRLFYLAERWLKSVLQTFERTCKQLISKQKGVSITKSSRDRRRSVEVLARSLGSEAGKTTAYVSFDMSEFSKKFPVALTRVFSKIIGEVAGDDDIALISEVFRHTFGGFTSDTFVGKIWGVEGGFEGFLNFTWTSIHEIIMQVALDEVGLKGVLETFSDDGILMVHIPDNELSAFPAKAKRIQAVYSEFGLEFQFSKTMVSTNVWEFLGDISIDGKVVPQFIKEAGKAGESRYGRSFSTASSTAEALFSQTAATIEHGLSVDLASVLSHFTILEYLRSYSPNLTPAELFYLIVAPPCMGGFRVPSLTEFAIKGYKSTCAELQADFEIGTVAFGDSFSRVLSNVLESVTKSTDDASCLVSSVPVAAPRLSIVSGSITDDLISTAVDRCAGIRLATNPMRGVLGKSLSKAARGATMLTPGILADLVMSSPVMMAYTSSIVFTESNALLKLVGREVIRRAQARDTRNLRRVHKVISGKNDGRVVAYWSLVDTFLRRSHPQVSFAPTPPSYRIILTPMLNKPNQANTTNVKFSFPSVSTYASIGLMESVEEFMPGTSISLWATEGAPNDPARARARYVDKAASFLASNPGLEGVVNIVAVASGLEPVVDESVFPLSEVRFSAGAHCTYTTYSPLKNATTITLAGGFKTLYDIQGRADRTSHIPNIKLMATAIYMTGLTRNGLHGETRVVYFDAGEDDIIRRHMLPRVKFPESGIHVALSDESFKTAYNAEVADAVAMEALATSLFINREPYDPLLAGCLAAELSAHIGSIMEGTVPNSLGPVIPTCYYPAVEQAIVSLVHSRMDPSLRGQFALSRAKVHPLTTADPRAFLAYPSRSTRPRFTSGAEFMRARVSDNVDPDYGVAKVISELSLQERELISRTWDEVLSAVRAVIPELAPENGYTSLSDFLEDLSTYAMSHSLFRTSQVVVVNAAIGLDGTRTSAIMSAYKRAITESLADVKMASMSKIIGRKGDVVDCLIALRSVIYPSAHRSEPWNHRVASAIYDCFTRVRALVMRPDFGTKTKEDIYLMALTECRLSLAGAHMLNDEVVQRLFEGTMQSSAITNHVRAIVSSITEFRPLQVLEDSCRHRARFHDVVVPLAEYLTKTFRIVKPSKLTVFMGSIDKNEGLRRIKAEASSTDSPLILSRSVIRKPTETEMARPEAVAVVSHHSDRSVIVDTNNIGDMIDMVAGAIIHRRIGVAVWSTVGDEGLVNHIFLTGPEPSLQVAEGANPSPEMTPAPLVARWVKGILCDSGTGVASFDLSLVTRFVLGSRIDKAPRGWKFSSDDTSAILSLAALARSCRIVDARLKVLIYLHFYHAVNGMQPPSTPLCMRIMREASHGSDIRFGKTLVVKHGKFLLDVQKVYAYLAAADIPAGTPPRNFGDYMVFPPIPYSVIWGTGGYIGGDYRSASGKLPGETADDLWVPDKLRYSIEIDEGAGDGPDAEGDSEEEDEYWFDESLNERDSP